MSYPLRRITLQTENYRAVVSSGHNDDVIIEQKEKDAMGADSWRGIGTIRIRGMDENSEFVRSLEIAINHLIRMGKRDQ